MEKLSSEGLQRLAGELMGSTRSSDHLSLGDGFLGGGGSPFPGRRLSSVRVKDKEERPGVLRKLSGKQDNPPTLVLTFTDEESTTTTHLEPADDSFPSGEQGSDVLQGFDSMLDHAEAGFQPNTLGVHHDKTDTMSVRSFMTDHAAVEEENVPEEVIQERAQRFWDFFTMVTSLSYAILNITFGLTMYCGDLFLVESYHTHFSEMYNLFLSSVGILWLLWFLLDIHFYIKSLRQHCTSSTGITLVEGEDGEFHIEIPMLAEKKKIPEYYGFSKGRESGSFFLKIGAAIFCFGHLSNILLHLVKNFHAYLEPITGAEREICVGGDVKGPILLVHDFVYFVFSILELFTIFAFGNVVVNKNKILARFGFMHCISASLCFWIYTIKNETLDSYVEKHYPHADCFHDTHPNQTTTTTTVHPHFFSSNSDDMLQCTKSSELSHTIDILSGLQCVIDTHHYCITIDHVTEVIVSAADWFYPFSIEFSIVVVGVWYILWSNIGKIEDNKHSLDFLPSGSPGGSQEELARTEGHKEALVLYADCSSSTKGMFVGIFFVLFSFTTCLTMYILNDGCNIETYIIVAQTMECAIFFSMSLACISLYYKIAQRDVNPNPISFLDDLLLIICLPAFFLFGILSLVANMIGDTLGVPFWLVAATRVLSMLQVTFCYDVGFKCLFEGVPANTNDYRRPASLLQFVLGPRTQSWKEHPDVPDRGKPGGVHQPNFPAQSKHLSDRGGLLHPRDMDRAQPHDPAPLHLLQVCSYHQEHQYCAPGDVMEYFFTDFTRQLHSRIFGARHTSLHLISEVLLRCHVNFL